MTAWSNSTETSVLQSKNEWTQGERQTNTGKRDVLKSFTHTRKGLCTCMYRKVKDVCMLSKLDVCTGCFYGQ